MAILSLALYGSRARGDFNNFSDIDLFAVTNEDHYKMIVDGSSNLACYPEKLALQRADSGDLFIFFAMSRVIVIKTDIKACKITYVISFCFCD